MASQMNVFRGAPSGKLVVTHRLKLEPQLLELLQSCFTEDRMNLPPTFAKCVDVKEAKDHTYFEGYYHGLPQTEAVRTINPRGGAMMDKPAAPKPVRAFVQAFNRRNEPLIEGVKKALGPDAAYTTLLNEGKAFADVAVQIHTDGPVTPEQAHMHVDRGNSLLHLAVSLNGQRGVHVVSKPDQTTADADDKSTADDPYGSQSDKPAEGQGLLSRVYRAVLGSRNTPTGAKPTSAAKRARHAHDSAYVSKSKREIHQQYPGDVYLSSPCFYLHGVDYPRSSWEDRTMAIQLRILMTAGDLTALHQDEVFKYQSAELAEALGNVMRTVPISLPSFAEVSAVLAELD